MGSVHDFSAAQGQLAGVVSGVRNRWRLKRALHGATITVAVGFVALAVSAYATRALHYGDVSLWVFRLLSLIAIVACAARFIVVPLRAAPRDAQVALYIEEHEPSLDGSVITAVDVHASPASVARSPALVARLLRSALDRMRRVDDGRAVDANDLQRTSIAFASVTAAAIGMALFGPGVLRHGFGLMLAPWGDANPASMFAIAVKPGNATIAKGGDQLVSATLTGFNAGRVELLVRPADSTAWTRVTMTVDSAGRYNYRLFDVGTVTEYSVEASGVRSPVYRLDVADLAYVKRLDLEYRYPAYTQLPVQHVDSTGDIAALKGTMVRVRVTPTRPTAGGRVIVQGGDTLQLSRTGDGALIAMLRVEREGFYKVELEGPDGRMVTGSLDYTIDALPDRPPTVSFVKPGRDTKVLSVDEVFTEARAQDDYGLSRLDLVYSVNGGNEKTVPLYAASGKISRDISAGHTFMLENEHLVAGDVVSYYARATDNNAVSGPQTATTDIYFLQVRPYGQDYRQQQSGGGGGGGGGQQDSPGPLSERQRQVVAASFNTARDSATLDKKTLDENLATLRLSQQKLREEVEQLAKRLVDRGIAASDSGWKKIATILPQAATQMDSAEKLLAKGTPHGALPPEQRALVQLQRAEAVFRDIQVSMGGGGGGGGGGGSSAQDLADIFELQKDKMRNQYETVQRGQDQQQQQAAASQVDETLEKLKQLAARQQQEDERMRRKADSLRGPGSTGSSDGASQRDLAQQAEQAARQLERLAREKQSQTLADAARRLQDAADAMKQAAANGKSGTAQGQRADDQLAAARRLLEQEKTNGAQRGLSDAQRTAQALADQERQVANDVAKLGQQSSAVQTAQGQQATQAEQRTLAAEKGAMADTLRDLQQRIDQLAGEQGSTQSGAARALGEASDSLRSQQVEDRIRASQRQLGTASQQYLDNLERTIGEGLNGLGQKLQKAAEASSQASAGDKQQQALDRMRDVVRGMETLDDRIRQQQAQAAQGQQQGQQQSQEPGQQKGQSQQGQSQQGQGQQGQGQQGQGQQGQGQQSQGQGQGQGQTARANGAGGRGGRGARRDGGSGGGTVAQDAEGGNRLSSGDTRQFASEMQQRVRDAEALRGELARQGADVSALDRALAEMRAAASPENLKDEKTGSELRGQVIDGLKAYEFALRRSLDAKQNGQVLAGRNGDVPAAFRAYVEEYYRSIAHSKPR